MKRLRSERGAGSILAVALVGAVAALTSLLLPLYLAFALRQSVAAAADASALAAADVAVGIAPGLPCVKAAEVARANGVTLASCTGDGVVVTVSVSRPVLGVAVTAWATAGPPRGGKD
jgi:secretion/DNA translocation related TadE-like protein